MVYSIIAIVIFLAAILFLVFKDNKKKKKLPETIYERIGVAAALMQQYFIDNNKTSDKNDRCIWNNASFVIAFLTELRICSVVDNVRLMLKFQHLYDDEDERFACGVWLREGISFYRKQVSKILNKSYTLPDVIVYNLLNPNIDKVSLEDLDVFDVDMIFSIGCWAYINNILERFFLSDPDIKNLPKGY